MPISQIYHSPSRIPCPINSLTDVTIPRVPITFGTSNQLHVREKDTHDPIAICLTLWWLNSGNGNKWFGGIVHSNLGWYIRI